MTEVSEYRRQEDSIDISARSQTIEHADGLDQELLTHLMDENARSPDPVDARAVTREAMVRSALLSAARAEEIGLPRNRIILSAKVSAVQDLIAVYSDLAARSDYALHLGLTEAGMGSKGIVASAAALGVLLQRGIGDTIRVSLTGPKTEEMEACYGILQALGLRRRGPELVSCPSCGRIEIDLMSLVEEVQSTLKSVSAPVKVAVMGCVVNGPGEARDADWGIFGGKGVYLLTRHGEIVERFTDGEDAKAALTRVLLESEREQTVAVPVG